MAEDVTEVESAQDVDIDYVKINSSVEGEQMQVFVEDDESYRRWLKRWD